MEIPEIKQKLTLATVLQHYGLKPDRNLRLHCPFHDDKTPSMQVYYKTHTAYCFSSNCKTHGKSLDVIDFVMYKENCTKHEALKKCGELITGAVQPQTQSRKSFLQNMFTYFKNAVSNSPTAKTYLESRCLDYRQLEVGFNGGQFHHGTRKDEALINQCLEYGLLLDKNLTSKTGEKAYSVFGKNCIVFPLKNKENEIVSLYFRSTANDKDQRHFYLKNRQGLYPGYPKTDTKTLILTESIIDAASLITDYELGITSGVCSVLALYGTNGLTEEHQQAIQLLPELEEIIFFLNGDAAGRVSTEKYAGLLKELYPNLKITSVEVPDNEDINSLLQSHEASIFTHLIENRVDFFLSIEKKTEKGEKEKGAEPKIPSPCSLVPSAQLDTRYPYKLRYTTDTANYFVQGGVGKLLDNLKITLVIAAPGSELKSRSKIDLYEDRQVDKLCRDAGEKLGIDSSLLLGDLYRLTDLLDEYREAELGKTEEQPENDQDKIYPLTSLERQKVEEFLKAENVMGRLNELLGQSGIAGEEKNRLFLLLIAISYKTGEPLHALIQGSSGSGKTRLLRQISDCIPQEKVIRLTRVSEKGFYNYPEKYLKNKLVCLEDVDGLGEEAGFALRELQSNGELNSATSVKLESGQIVSSQRRVEGPIATLSCTTQGELYEDNMSRVFLIAVDESPAQTQRIIEYQNRKAAGKIDARGEQQIKKFLQLVIREIQPFEIVNPLATCLHLPEGVHKIRRLNDLLQSFVKMVTLVHQHQRKRDARGRLIARPEDLSIAIDIMFESIVLKVDELDGSLRQFYEKLKTFVEKTGRSYEFTRFEVRRATGLGKTQQHHYLNKLVELEYLKQFGFSNRGFRYKIAYWDDYGKLREEIKTHLQKQVQQLESKNHTKAGVHTG